MNIGLFGGTFDPVHRGHLALARAAQERFRLGKVLFVPASIPPHKQRQPVAPYFHRFAMLALATEGEKTFLPCDLEAPPENLPADGGRAAGLPSHAGQRAKAGSHGHTAVPGANYSIDTVRRLKLTLKKKDRLFFLIGIDAFLEIATWHEPEALLRQTEFIVASRPGHSLAEVARALPEALRPAPAVARPFQRQPAKGDLVLGGATIHLLEGVNQPVSATAVRQAVASGRPLGKLLPPAVADYIKKMHLYQVTPAGAAE